MKHLEKIVAFVIALAAVYGPLEDSPTVQEMGGKTAVFAAALVGLVFYYLAPRLRESKLPLIAAPALWAGFWVLHVLTVIRRSNGEYVQGPLWNTTDLTREDALEGARNAVDAFGLQVRVAQIATGALIFLGMSLGVVLVLRVVKDPGFKKDVHG